MVVAFGSGAAEEEGGEGGAVVAFEAKGPVLIFGGEGFVFVAAFSDEVSEPAVAEGVEADPGFDGEGVAVGEAKGGVVGELPGGGAVELEGGVFYGEAGVFGRDEGALRECGVSGGGAGFILFEVPQNERGDLGGWVAVFLGECIEAESEDDGEDGAELHFQRKHCD